jgi:hypothetical protein
MAYGLFTSVETPRGWAVMLWNSSGRFQSQLPEICETKEDAERYAKAYLRLFN